jgi:hypothetical protein
VLVDLADATVVGRFTGSATQHGPWRGIHRPAATRLLLTRFDATKDDSIQS